jgi:hypothetical protein
MSTAPCKRCGQRPKALPAHRCTVCLEVALPPAEQAARALWRASVWNGSVPPGAEINQVKTEQGLQFCRGCGTFRVIDIVIWTPEKGIEQKVKLHVASGASRCRACIAVGRRQAIYGITPEQQAAMLAAQDNRCAICGKHGRDRALAVDHNHKTGKVRGFVCKQCNHDLLGNLHDSPELALKALVYLLSPPADDVLTEEGAATWDEIRETIDRMLRDMEGA